MKQRCNNPNNPAYKYYGELGITYDSAWETFTGFYADMGATWFPGATLDRVNSAKGYTKTNCRWIVKADQMTVGRQGIRYNNKSGIKGVEIFRGGWRVLVRERGKPRNKGKKTTLYTGNSFEEACRVRKEWEDRESKILASSLK